MPERSLTVKLIADSASLQRELKKAQAALRKYQAFAEQGAATNALANEEAAVRRVTDAERELVKVRAPRGGRLGPFRLAGVGLAAGLGLNVALQTSRALAESLETTGAAAFTTTGKLKNMTAALIGGDIIGAVRAIDRTPQSLEELGVQAGFVARHFEAFNKVAEQTTKDLGAGRSAARFGVGPLTDLAEAQKETGVQSAKAAEKIRDEGLAMYNLKNATAAAEFAHRKFNLTVVDGVEMLVAHKRAADDVIRAGVNLAPTAGPLRSTYPDVPERRRRRTGITAGQRNQWFDARMARQLDILQDKSLRQQLVGLQAVEETLRARLAITNDTTRQLTLQDQIRSINREQLSIQEQIGDEMKRQNDALKARAQAIKSAIIERLQARQTNILNQRALVDAKEQLAIALRLGGPKGIQAAKRTLADVKMDMLIARVQQAPAALTRGGMFSLGGVITININGITDPEAVARKVEEVLKRRNRHTNKASRGPTAGSTAGTK